MIFNELMYLLSFSFSFPPPLPPLYHLLSSCDSAEEIKSRLWLMTAFPVQLLGCVVVVVCVFNNPM